MDEAAHAHEDPRKSLRWAVAVIALAIGLALIAPALPGGPHKPKPMEHHPHEATVGASTAPPAPPQEQQQNDQTQGLWPAVFFIGSGAVNSGSGSGTAP